MNIRKTLLSGILASSMTLGGAAAFAQDSTPDMASPDAEATPTADLIALAGIGVQDADGQEVAQVDVWEDEDGEGVWVKIYGTEISALEEGKYGVHIHETGTCDGDMTFDSAGGHYNPTIEDHGDVNADPSHGGDLGNLEVDGDGNIDHEVLAEKVTMISGEPNSLADEDGSAIVIHAGEDDLESNPSGESGDRWACAVIFPPTSDMGTPAASPEASPTN